MSRYPEKQTLTVHLTESEKLALLKLCNHMGMTMTSVIRSLIREKTKGNVQPVELYNPQFKTGGESYKKGSVAYYMNLSLRDLLES